MDPVAISFIVFLVVFGGALLGMLVRTKLPEHHLNADSRNVVTLGVGLVATMAALVLGLLISSAKSYFDTQNNEITQMSANVILLDRVLAHYGPEATEIRTVLRKTVAGVLDLRWSKNIVAVSPSTNLSGTESLYDKIQSLTPQDDAHLAMKSRALSILGALASSRVLMYEQSVDPISSPLLVILVFWLTIIFVSFGIFTTANATTITSLCVSALSVSSAILLILALHDPYGSLIRVSSAPVRAALERLGQ